MSTKAPINTAKVRLCLQGKRTPLRHSVDLSRRQVHLHQDECPGKVQRVRNEGRQTQPRHLRPPGRDVHHPEDHGQRICGAGQEADGIYAQGITVMTENVFTPHTEPTLHRNLELPKGVLQKNLKTFVYLGAASLVILAALFSSSGKKTPAQQASAKGQPPQPTLQDNTDSNVQDLKNQVQ